MKKLLTAFIVVCLCFPSAARAVEFDPMGLIHLIVKTTEADRSFDFVVYGDNDTSTPYKNLSVTTIHGLNGGDAFVNLALHDTYTVEEIVPVGWTASIQCHGFPGTTFTYSNASVRITHLTTADLEIDCEVTNTEVVTPKTPILIVPGIMGTEITKGDDLLWSDVSRMITTPGDAFMDSLQLKDNGTPLDTSLEIADVIRSKSAFGKTVFDYTAGLITELATQGYTLGLDLFLFPYDWRRSLDEVATVRDQTLKNSSLQQTIDRVLQTTGADKISIIAHSQGGLVVKQLLYQLPEYKALIDKLILVGVPNVGAPKAAKTLLYGDTMDVAMLGLGLASEEVQKIGHNMPALYELLPSKQYIDKHGPYLAGQQGRAYTFFDDAATNHTLEQEGLNAGLLERARQFHEAAFDTMDFSDINVSNIVGCQTGTYDTILQPLHRSPVILTTAGDGTVPLDSAQAVNGATTYYALRSSHGTMLTAEGIRQEIVNLVTGSNLSTQGNIVTNAQQCHYNATLVSVHSPVELHVYDGQGNHLGPNASGGFDMNIPDAEYDVRGHDKFAILPDSAAYHVELFGLDIGTFDLYVQKIIDGHIATTAFYNQVPVIKDERATLNLTANNNQSLQLQTNSDGNDDLIVPPSSILNSTQSEDFIAPTTTATADGSTVSLFATDDASPSASGILRIEYAINGGEYQDYSTAITLSQPGVNIVRYYSIDQAGNREDINSVTVDVPESVPSPATNGIPPPYTFSVVSKPVQIVPK